VRTCTAPPPPPPLQLQPGPTPACFYPHTDGYTSSPPTPTGNGFTSTLTLGAASGPFRNDVASLSLSVQYLTQTSMRFTITDPATERWVPPVPLQPQPTTAPATMDYRVDITQAPEPFGITVTRTSNGQVLFDSRVPATAPVTGGLVFEDQYLELSTRVPVLPDGSVPIYGLAEHVTPFKLPSNGTAGQTYTMLARDQGTPVHNQFGNTNLYASHPFYLSLDPATGEAYGVFVFNSNAMDIVLQPGALTYRIIGGVLDVYVFTGPTPAAVVQQYQVRRCGEWGGA
jgi:lysosomal alpha-glucosidase